MFTKTRLVFLFFLFTQNGFAQQAEIDSLLGELKKYTAADTTRINILNDLSYDYYQLDPDRGIACADEAIELSRKIKDEKRMAYAFQYKGINHAEKGEYAASLELYKQAASILERINEPRKLMAVRNSMAISYMRLSDYSKALKLYYKNLHGYESLKMERETAMTNGNIALVYGLIGEKQKALLFNEKAIEIRKKLNDERGLADLFNSRANMLDDMGKVDEAIPYYRQSLSLSNKVVYVKGVATALVNLGNAYNELKQTDSAFYYAQFALEQYKKMGDKNNEAISLDYLGKIIINADNNFLKKQGIADKYNVALKYHNESLAIAREIENVYAQAEELETISSIYKQQDKYDKALEAYEEHVKLKDSILNDEKKEAVHQTEMQYAVQKKEDSLTLAQQKKDLDAKAEINRQKTIKQFITVGGGVLLVAALVSFMFYKKRRDAKQKQQEAEFKTEVAGTEMKALRAQMNPHFIFNSLNSISDYIAKNDMAAADKYLSKFAKLMRRILENSEQKEVPLAEDLKALELYMQLESLRMNNKFSYEIKVDDDIDKETILVPPLILQPFVENSIWHGIAEKEGHGNILIHIKKEGDNLINCIVEDNGVGRKQPSIANNKGKKENSSLGMRITQSRIDILNRIKNTNATVQLTDLAQGLRVEVKLPFATNF